MERVQSALLLVFSIFCVAVNAYWTPEPQSYTCCASGDPHYKLFDGQWIHFQGECKYLLAGTCHNCSDLDAFHVFVDNKPFASNPSVSYTDLVEIHYAGHVVIFEAGQPAKVDGSTVPLPYVGVPGATVSNPVGNKFVFDTIDGLEVTYQYNHIVCVTVPCTYRGQMCGICGNMNNVQDDYFTSDGTDVSAHPNKFNLIGNSWEVAGGDCPQVDSANQRQQDYQPPTVDSPCCEVLLGEVDSPVLECVELHTELAMEYHSACMYDVGADPENPMGCCDMIQAFVAECQALEVAIVDNWRDYFPNCRCEQPMIYTDAMSACPLTCPALTDSDCNAYMGPGCVCPRDMYLYPNGRCSTECYIFEQPLDPALSAISGRT